MQEKYRPLFETFRFKNGVELKNRIVMAPMTTWSSHEDGTVTDREVEYYERRSNGVGMVVTACTFVTPNGKGFHGEFGAHTDEMIPSLRQLADAIKGRGAKAVLQIFHGGHQCPPDLVPNGEPVSASDVKSDQEWAVAPRPLTDGEIEEIVRAFGETTRRAIEAGYDGVEIHGANGYLLHQFFSPHTNRREDRWGGTLEKRMAFPLAVVDEVKRVVAEHGDEKFLVGYRFSPEEPEEDGFTMGDTLQFLDALAGKDLDYLHISLMEYRSTARRGVEDMKRTRMELVQERVGHLVPVIGVGSIHTADEALDALELGVPLVALGRELIMEPDWVEKVQEGREAEIRTTLTKNDQAELVVPDPLWYRVLNAKGWFPVVEV